MRPPTSGIHACLAIDFSAGAAGAAGSSAAAAGRSSPVCRAFRLTASIMTTGASYVTAAAAAAAFVSSCSCRLRLPDATTATIAMPARPCPLTAAAMYSCCRRQPLQVSPARHIIQAVNPLRQLQAALALRPSHCLGPATLGVILSMTRMT